MLLSKGVLRTLADKLGTVPDKLSVLHIDTKTSVFNETTYTFHCFKDNSNGVIHLLEMTLDHAKS